MSKVSVWRIGNKYIFNCHDIHNYCQTLNSDQIHKLKEIIPSLNDPVLIMENQPASAQEYRAKNLFNVAAEVQDLFLKQSFRVESVDFRHKIGRSYYMCLGALGCKSDTIQSLNKELITLGLTTPVLTEEFENAFNQIQTSIEVAVSAEKISLIVARMLHQTCDDVKTFWGNQLEGWSHCEGSLLDYCITHDCFNATYLSKVLTFSRHILDVALLVSALMADTQIVFIVAGSIHAQSVEYLLQCAGATELSHEGISVPVDVGLKLPSHISVEKSSNYFMTAEALHLQNGQPITPVSPLFFDGFLNRRFSS